MDPELTLVLWTLVVAALVSVSCAIVGCYLVLRKLSLIGDAISHAVLPGIVLVYLQFETRTGIPLLIGAVLTGLLTAFLTTLVSKGSGVREDAGMGIVFTSMFALGVVMISRNLRQVDLDVNCVLMGQLELVPHQTSLMYGIEVPDMIPRLALVFLGVCAFVLLCWKELKIASFDPALATAMGISATLFHYLLMATTATVTVASFEAVGSILVIAMLIVPPAAAHLLTTRLRNMMLVSALLALGAAVGGILAARFFNANYAGMMSVVAGVEFGLAVLFAPHTGVVQRMIRSVKLRFRIVAEDVLALLYRREEVQSETPRVVVHRVTGRWFRRFVLGWLHRKHLVRLSPGGMLELTDDGRRRAASLVRAHRLWETYLQNEMALPSDHLHEPAEWMEHYIDEEMQKELHQQVGQPAQDPHGRPIPPVG